MGDWMWLCWCTRVHMSSPVNMRSSVHLRLSLIHVVFLKSCMMRDSFHTHIPSRLVQVGITHGEDLARCERIQAKLIC